jgi:DNA excision repair protein ERCC-5
MLLGGDYTDGVRGVGIVNGMEIIKAFPVSESVQNGLLEFRKWLESDEISYPAHSSQEHFHRKHLSARMRWTTPTDFPSPNVLHAYMNPVVGVSDLSLSWDQPNIPALKHLCKLKMGWSEGKSFYGS